MALTSDPVFVGKSSVECSSQPRLLAVIAGALPELRTADSGRLVPADEIAIGVFTDDLVGVEVLGNDDVAFHAHHLSDVRVAAGAIAQARGLHDDVDRGTKHFTDGARRQRVT